MTDRVRSVFENGNGILRMKPIFVPRRCSKAGQRLRLHPDDYYALGMERGALKERWFSSVIQCFNGPLTASDEGLSYVACSNDPNDVFTLKTAVETLKEDLLGGHVWNKYGTWPMYSKFFDFEEPLFHHLHLTFEAAARIGKLGKPEGYYYPPQYNNYPGTFPHTYFGFDPDVTKEDVKARLADFDKKDTAITELSRAYKIELGSGWYTPPGVIHAPGSYLTYEPQWNSDVNSAFENVTRGEVTPHYMLDENCPDDKKNDLDYLISLLDWEKNVEPHYKKRFERRPIIKESNSDYTEKWIMYANEYFAAKELTVYPGKSCTITDSVPYGCIIVQGYGSFGKFPASAAGMLRYGQLSEDEFFVGSDAAAHGVRICNSSTTEPLVMLKHFPVTEDAPGSN